jgi:hypothetical protein
MPPLPADYVRKGRPCYFQLDHDAWQLLQEIAPTQKAYGRYVSELIRRDAVRRAEWAQLRAVQQAALAQVGAGDDE